MKSRRPFPKTIRWRPAALLAASLAAASLSAAESTKSPAASATNTPAVEALTPQQQFEGGDSTNVNWIELSTGALLTQGNANQAGQRDRLARGVFGGIEDLHYQRDVAKDTSFTLDGRSIFDEHDYNLTLGLKREEMGFLRFHFENFRTWDSGNGGFSPVDMTAYSLPGDALALDRGKISFEAGLTEKDFPKITFKYTHSYRDGEKSSTLWGAAPVVPTPALRLYPGILDIDETSDAFQLDVTHRIKKTDVGLGIRFETGEINNAHKLTSFATQKITDRQDTAYDMLSVHAFTETWIKQTLFFSTGFMFANLDDTFTGSRIYGDDFDVVYAANPLASFGYYNLNGGAHKNEYVLNINLMALPTKDLTITPSIRVQMEDWDAHTEGMGTLADKPAELFSADSSRCSLDVRERLDARYTGVTNWVFNASGEWTEGQGNLKINNGLGQIAGIGSSPVLAETDDSRFFQKYSLSARWYPARQASLDFGAYYKINKYDYNHTQDSTANDLSTGDAYPAFLVYQGFETWDGNVRLTLRPTSKITLVSRYEYQISTIRTRPDFTSGLSEADASRMNSHIFGQNASWTPLNWLCLQAGFNYVVSTTKTPTSDYTQAVLNSQNNYWTVNFNSTFVLDDRTDLNVGYYYYRAADSQNAIGGGLPLGADSEEHSVTAMLTRRITKNLRLNLKYAFTHYEDYASAGNFNFSAHVIFTSLQYRF